MFRGTRVKSQKYQWVDSKFRFFARVSSLQDNLPLVRMDVSVPHTTQSFLNGEVHIVPEEDLYIQIQEVVLLRPYQPGNVLLSVNPSLYEVSVRVDNFWGMIESGGNSGRPVRRGTIYVIGEVADLLRLRGKKDTRFTSRNAGICRNDGSGVRGLNHVLQGNVNIRRLRTFELASITDFNSKWVCIDYSATHKFHCSATPICNGSSDNKNATVNAACFKRDNLFLKRQWDNVHDKNAISVVCQKDGVNTVVGFVPKELAACLAPAMDAGISSVTSKGIYSDIDKSGDKHHRIWFCVETTYGGSGVVTEGILVGLKAISWWVVDHTATT
jgi:hypothetical protein